MSPVDPSLPFVGFIWRKWDVVWFETRFSKHPPFFAAIYFQLDCKSSGFIKRDEFKLRITQRLERFRTGELHQTVKRIGCQRLNSIHIQSVVGLRRSVKHSQDLLCDLFVILVNTFGSEHISNDLAIRVSKFLNVKFG